MYKLSDLELFDCYKKSLELNLDPDFIQLLESELSRRHLGLSLRRDFFTG